MSQSRSRSKKDLEVKVEPETEQEEEEESVEPPLKRKKGSEPNPTCAVCYASAGDNRKGDSEVQTKCSNCCNTG